MRLRRLAGLLLALLLLTGLPPAAPTSAAPPTGFDSAVVPGLDTLNQPTAFAFLPDGSMLITTKPGRLLLYQGGALRPTPVFDAVSRTCSDFERGLLGVAVDPNFSANRAVYVYYTFNRRSSCATNNVNEPVNRVSRLTLSAGLTTDSETVLVDNIPSPNANHNAGDLHIGKDGYLYISTGDGGANAGTAQQLFNLAGKILRISTDGGIPADNPFVGANSARCNAGAVDQALRCQEIFAYGFRNPFRIAFDPNAAGTRFYVNDVGAGSVEEISEGRAGGNFGWNCFEGTRVNTSCPSLPIASTVQPTFEYRRGQGIFDGCASITGGAFVPAGRWPAGYDGAYLFGDYVCKRIFVLFPNGSAQTFEPAAEAVTHMAFGPDGAGQALYYASINTGDITRVRFTAGANRAPTARLTATPLTGPPPLTVGFNAGASSDPDAGDSIAAYLWDFGNGQTRETAGATTSFVYQSAGTFNASVRVRDSRGAVSAPAAVRVDVGNAPPVAEITAPQPGGRYSVGETIALRGGASDPEDGALSGRSLTWNVIRHHNDHTHPFLTDAEGPTASIQWPTPEDLAAVDTNWLEVTFTARDAQGVTTTVTRELRPRIVTLRLESEPPGLQVAIDDSVATTNFTAPTSVRSWPGWGIGLSAPAGQQVNGVTMKLCGWRHGGAPSQTYVTPGSDATLRAIFGPADRPCAAQVGAVRVFLPVSRR